MIKTDKLKTALMNAKSKRHVEQILFAWMIANAIVFESERASLKAIFSPTAHPVYHNMIREIIINFQHENKFHPGYDVSFSADGDRFSLIRTIQKTNIKNNI